MSCQQDGLSRNQAPPSSPCSHTPATLLILPRLYPWASARGFPQATPGTPFTRIFLCGFHAGSISSGTQGHRLTEPSPRHPIKPLLSFHCILPPGSALQSHVSELPVSWLAQLMSVVQLMPRLWVQFLYSPQRQLTFWVSLMAHTVKNPPAMQKTWVWFLHQEDPLKKGMVTHSSILAWRISWIDKPGGYNSP